MKVCSKCGETKPLDAFYRRPDSKDGRHNRCSKCDSERGRQSAVRINRNRARHRAVADLIERHRAEYEALLALRVAEAEAEAEALRQAPEASEHYKGEPVRLRPGARAKGQRAGDRIDVARCPHCIRFHDHGHVCRSCGLAPAGALRINGSEDDGHIDEIAVERATHGDPVRLTRPEQVEAIRRMAARGKSDAQIAAALHCTAKTVERRRAEYTIESRWTA